MNKTPSLFRILALFVVTLATANSTVAAPFHASQWVPTDLVFHAPAPAGTEFEVEFTATFSGPDSSTLTVPGFYDGGDHFVIRFAPPKSGHWTYLTSSSLPQLHQQKGTVHASAAPAHQRGPVGISARDPRKFAYADGTGYFPLAFEVDWLFAIDAENPADIPRTRQLTRHIRDNGFNQVVMNVFAYDVNWPRDPKLDVRYDYGKPRVFPYAGDNTNPDFSTLNVEFFQRLDRVITHLDEQGIIAHLMIYVWNKQVAWPDALSDADNLYFDYVVKRYQAYSNLIWDISKEATGYGHNDKSYIVNRIDRLRALDAYDRLVTVHDYGYCHQYPETVDFISVQNWKSEIWSAMRDIVEKPPAMPVFNIEHGGYEKGPYHVFTGSYLTPLSNLERAYKILFAGVSLTHYWQDTSWNVVIHDIENLPAADQPRLDYYRHLADFIAEQNVDALEVTNDASSAGFCLSNQDNVFLFYLPEEYDAIVVRRQKGYETGTLHYRWFDPLTGNYSKETSEPVEQWNRLFTPQPYQMRILLVRLTKD